MSQRIQKIKDTYSEQLRKRLEQEKIDISLDSAWDIMVSADPSYNKKNLRWVVETYINNGYQWEDISSGPASQVSETLTEFDKHKSLIDMSNRSLNVYRTLDELYDTILCYVGHMSNRDKKRSLKAQVYNETCFVIDTDDLRVICPLTPGSAAWWSRGTKWCTSGHNDFFEQYAKLTPLFIVIFKEDGVERKVQLWKEEGDIQLIGEKDEVFEIEEIEKNWNILKPLIEYIDDPLFIPEIYENEPYILDKTPDIANSHNIINFEEGQSIAPYIPQELYLKEINALSHCWLSQNVDCEQNLGLRN